MPYTIKADVYQRRQTKPSGSTYQYYVTTVINRVYDADTGENIVSSEATATAAYSGADNIFTYTSSPAVALRKGQVIVEFTYDGTDYTESDYYDSTLGRYSITDDSVSGVTKFVDSDSADTTIDYDNGVFSVQFDSSFTAGLFTSVSFKFILTTEYDMSKLFLLKVYSGDTEYITASDFIRVATPEDYQAVDPTEIDDTAYYLLNTTDFFDISKDTDDPTLRQIVLATPGEFDYYNSNILVKYFSSLSDADAHADAVIESLRIFVERYNTISSQYTTMDDPVTYPDGYEEFVIE